MRRTLVAVMVLGLALGACGGSGDPGGVLTADDLPAGTNAMAVTELPDVEVCGALVGPETRIASGSRDGVVLRRLVLHGGDSV